MRSSALGLTLLLSLVVVGGCRRPTPAAKAETHTVTSGTVISTVVESGGVEAIRVVEVKSRVAGRVSRLLVDEGDTVEAGQLIAEIDPTETELQVKQNRAQVRGAEAAVSRTSIEIEQRRISAAASVAQARARLAQVMKESEAQPSFTRTGIVSAESALRQAQQSRRQMVESSHPNERSLLTAEVDQAQASLDNAKLELNRLKALVTQEFVAQREVDAQQLQVDLAESRLLSAKDRLRRLQNQQANELKTADERIRAAEADLSRAKTNGIQDNLKRSEVQTAQAQLRQAEAGLRDVLTLQASRAQSQASVDQLRSVLSDSERQLRETEIRAPRSGIIVKRLIQEGELVSSLSSFSSGTPIVRMEDRSQMLVKLNINEIDTAKLRLGMTATVEVDALPGKKFAGKVTKIAPAKLVSTNAADNVVRYEVEVELADKGEEIKSGMTAKVTVETAKRTNVVQVPVDYLVKEGSERFVLVENGTDKPAKTKVTIGVESAGQVEILSGIRAGVKLQRPAFDGPERRGFGGPNS